MGKLSAADYKIIKELVVKNTSVEELAEMYGLSRSTMYYHMNKAGCGKKHRKFTQVELKSMINMFNEGYSLKDIAKEYGVTSGTVRNKLRDKVDFRKKVIKKCESCDAEFEVNRKSVKNKKFCSKKCAAYVNNRRSCGGPIDKECHFCGKSFKTHKTSYNLQKFCSDNCRMKDYFIKNKVVTYKKCKYCNNEFEVGRRKTFCSEECAKKHNNLQQKKKWRFKKCRYCKKWRYGFTGKYCSEQCRKRVKRIKHELQKNERLKRARSNGQFDADIDIYKLIERDGGRCYLCGDDVLFSYHYNHPKYPTIEHVMPISKGGAHSWDNVKVACRECNTYKSTTLIDDYLKGR